MESLVLKTFEIAYCTGFGDSLIMEIKTPNDILATLFKSTLLKGVEIRCHATCVI